MSRIGRYEVEAEIGRGASGVVYLASDPRLERRVAIKSCVIPEGLGVEERREFRERFVREARAAALLQHPAIVTIFDVEATGQDDTPFIAMEHIDGKSLKELLDREGPLDSQRAVRIAVEVAGALHEAHRHGIVHRDVKPANILVRETDGAVKITDFGIAKLAASELTRSGTTLGSPAYMSPEQIAGASLDGRSDLFSLAVILYESICGRRPFRSDEIPALFQAILHEDPEPISRSVEGLDRSLDAFFERALAKRPEDRFGDADEFRRALLEVLDRRGRNDGAAASRTPSVVPAGPVDDLPACFTPAAGEEDAVSVTLRRRLLPFVVVPVVVLLVGLLVFGGQEKAYLQLDVRNSLGPADLVVLVDGKRILDRRLEGAAGSTGLIRKVLERNVETFEVWLDVPAGRHELAAQVHAADLPDPYRDSVTLELEPGESRRLRLVVGRAFGRNLALRLD